MPYEPKEGWISLFPNDNKTEPKHPDFKGSGPLDGRKVYVAAWKKKIQRGEHAGDTFLTLHLERPRKSEDYAEASRAASEPKHGREEHKDFDDDIPF